MLFIGWCIFARRGRRREKKSIISDVTSRWDRRHWSQNAELYWLLRSLGKFLPPPGWYWLHLPPMILKSLRYSSRWTVCHFEHTVCNPYFGWMIVTWVFWLGQLPIQILIIRVVSHNVQMSNIVTAYRKFYWFFLCTYVCIHACMDSIYDTCMLIRRSKINNYLYKNNFLKIKRNGTIILIE